MRIYLQSLDVASYGWTFDISLYGYRILNGNERELPLILNELFQQKSYDLNELQGILDDHKLGAKIDLKRLDTLSLGKIPVIYDGKSCFLRWKI